MTVYEFEMAIDELLDKALNELSPAAYEKLLDSLSMMIDERMSD